IGTALGTVVKSLVDDVIMPPIGYVLGGVDFANLKIVLAPATLNPPKEEVAISYGLFINSVITFIVVAFVVFWIARVFVKPGRVAPHKYLTVCEEAHAEDAPKCRACGSQS